MTLSEIYQNKIMKQTVLILIISILSITSIFSQKKKNETSPPPENQTSINDQYSALKFRNIGPFRGGRTNAVTGVLGDPMTYFFGGVGGGVWKTEDAGYNWKNISDGHFGGSVGAITIAPSDKNVIYVGMGEHAVRGVMTSHGNGIYKSTDFGQTWTHIGLENSRHISAIRVHPQNPDVLWVAAQGSVWQPTKDRGIYKSTDGGKTWVQILFVNETTAASDLSLDATNPRILYAGMWDNQRVPWQIRSGGEGSGIYKSTDGGETWNKLEKGLPKVMGKVAVDVSPANPQRVFANIEAEKGGVFRSDDGGKTWTQTNSQRVTIARAWYYIEIFADPVNADIVYVLNAPMLKSTDGGKTFKPIPNPHTDQHDLWINPDNPKNVILGNDGGACISFNGGETWSAQNNQPTAQFYRVIADNQFPYRVYGGQQDNSAISIASRTMDGGIDESDWHSVAGGESAFIAFDPDNPELVFGTSIQGFVDVFDYKTKISKSIIAYPSVNLGRLPKDMKYRFNWNNPIVAQPQNPSILYYGAQKVLRSDSRGLEWKEISSDLTRNEVEKHGEGGIPFTNEAAGGEVYNTISYIQCSPHSAGTIWVGTDDGLVQVTTDEGKNWQNVTPPNLQESLINAIEVSPHEPAIAYLAVTRYKFNDLTPMIFVTNDFGKTWRNIANNLPKDNFVRVVREDHKRKGLLYAGTENGLYISFDAGENWHRFQSNLPECPITDLTIADNDLVVATSGRAFWILDDLSVFQQTRGNFVKDKMRIFSPKANYKYSQNIPNRVPKNRGQNYPSGLIFDYYLPETFTDTSELTLVISDVFQNEIRTYSNKKNKSKTWTGGPPPSPVLPSKKGLNRFNWDLRKNTLPGIQDIFVMGDYRGHTIIPGDYLFKLMSEKDTAVSMIKILPNPHLRADLSAHGQQQALLNEIEKTYLDVHRSVTAMRSVKHQLKKSLKILKEIEGQEKLIENGETVLESIRNWEKPLIQPRQETYQDVINFRNQLNSELLSLKSQIDQSEPMPTNGVQIRLKELIGVWGDLKTEMQRIISEEVEGFNAAYGKAGFGVLVVPE